MLTSPARSPSMRAHRGFLRRAFMLLAGLTGALQGCHAEGNQTARASGPGRCEVAGALALDPSVIATFNRAETPEAIAANSENVVVVHAGGRQLTVVPLNGGEVRSTAVTLEGDISAIARLPSGFVIAEDRQLHAFDDNDLSLRPMPGVIARGAVQAVSATDRELWAVSRLGSRWWLTVFHLNRTTQQYTRMHETSIDSESSIHAYDDGRVLVTQIRHPYTISVYDSTLRVRDRFSVEQHRAFRAALRDSQATMSLQAMPLDCGRILQVFVDVVSGDRLLAVLDLTDKQHVRLRKVDVPIGLSQALTEARILIGAVEQPAGLGVVSYRWRWDSSSVETPHRE